MSQRIFFYVVVLIFLFNGEILAQEKNVEKFPVFPTKYRNYCHFLSGKENVNFLIKTPVKRPGRPLEQIQVRPGCGTVPLETSLFITRSTSKSFLTPDYYVSQLGFFCRTELKIEKATSIPFRFRLGSLQYTDYLEQKPNALR
jgi:hypothetical protein